jgi:hypothetical protein
LKLRRISKQTGVRESVAFSRLAPDDEGLNGPIGRDLASEVSAHEFGAWYNPDSSQIQPISVPAGGNGRIVMVIAIRMPNARMMEKLEAVVGQFVSDAAQGGGVLRSTCTVTFIPPIVHAAAVVKESEKTNDHEIGSGAGCKQEPIAFDPPPVIWAMNRIARRMKLPGHELPEIMEVYVHVLETQYVVQCILPA